MNCSGGQCLTGPGGLLVQLDWWTETLAGGRSCRLGGLCLDGSGGLVDGDSDDHKVAQCPPAGAGGGAGGAGRPVPRWQQEDGVTRREGAPKTICRRDYESYENWTARGRPRGV
jgi:hypothetical protein